MFLMPDSRPQTRQLVNMMSRLPDEDLTPSVVITPADVSATLTLLQTAEHVDPLLDHGCMLLMDVQNVDKLFDLEDLLDKQAAEQWSIDRDALDWGVCDKVWELQRHDEWIEGMSDNPVMPSGRRFEEVWARYCRIRREETVATLADFEQLVHTRYF